MTVFILRNRRQVLALLGSTALGSTLRRAGAGPFDQGIGGTGAVPPTDESDRGIGGTGVIGTIRKFGSIIVNDLRIAYSPDVAVNIDGYPASVADLRVGQVVRVAATRNSGALSTRVIDVTSEVVGPIERIGARQITVLGQVVTTTGLGKPFYRLGDSVAVSGLRRNDGVVVASLIEARPDAASRVAGPVRLADDGNFRIGDLQLSGLDPSLVGQRAIVDGRSENGRFVVARSVSETSLLPDVRMLSIESYVERRGDRLALGSGLAVQGAGLHNLPAGRSIRAVLTTTLSSNRRLSIEGARFNGRSYGAVPGGAGAPSGERGSGGPTPTLGPNGHIPMNFDRGLEPSGGGQGAPENGFTGRPGGGLPGGPGGFARPGASGGPGGRR